MEVELNNSPTSLIRSPLIMFQMRAKGVYCRAGRYGKEKEIQPLLNWLMWKTNADGN